MARDRGEYYSGVDPNSPPRGQLGALARTSGSGGGQPLTLSQMTQPQEDPEMLRERNQRWIQDPQTQAAMLAFATTMLQPLGNAAGGPELLGAIGTAIGNSARAAQGIQAASLEEAQALQEMQLRERSANLQERRFGLELRQEERLTRAEEIELRKLATEERTARLTAAQAARKAELEEKKTASEMRKTEAEIGKIEAETEEKKVKAGQRKYSKVISATDPINQKYGLGLTGSQQAKVEVTEDKDGNVIAADLEGSFGTEGATSNVAKLQKDLAAAKARGDEKSARELQRQIDDESTKTISETGVETFWNPETNQYEQREVTGGKAEREREESERAAEEKKQMQAAEGTAVLANIDDAINMLENPPTFLGMNLPPDTFLTGMGSYIKYLGGTPAKDMAEILNAIGSRVQLTELQKIRNANQGVSGFGNLSNFEGMTVRSAWYSLEQSQTKEQLVKNLRRFQQLYADATSKNGGQLGALGRMVDQGKLTPEEAQAELDAIYGSASFGMMPQNVPPPETDVDTSQPPAGWSEEDKLNWQYIPEEQRRGILRGEIK